MDKRKSIRKFSATGIELYNLEGKSICTATVNDVSKGGILIIFYDSDKFDSFSPGTKINFKLIIPTGQILGLAEVSWTNHEDSRMGLRFLRIDNEEGTSNLMAFVAGGFI